MSRVAIRPYISPNDDNMGLSRAGQVLFDKTHDETLTCLYRYGRPRYITGLDEFAPEVEAIENADEKAARILEIRKIVSQLEPRFGGKQVAVDDAEFWNKIEVLNPSHDEFWKKFEVKCGNQPIYLDPTNNPEHLLLQYAIEAGGFTIVAPSLEVARSSQNNYKFFFDKADKTVSLNTEAKKLRNQAGALLQNLYEKDLTRLLYVAKIINPNSAHFKKSTNKDIVYESLDLFLDGQMEGSPNKRENALKFIKLAKSSGADGTDLDTLKLRALIKDATFHRLFSIRPDGQIYDVTSASPVGRTPEEALEFLKSPLNDAIYTALVSKVEKHW